MGLLRWSSQHHSLQKRAIGSNLVYLQPQPNNPMYGTYYYLGEGLFYFPFFLLLISVHESLGFLGDLSFYDMMYYAYIVYKQP